MLQDERRHSGDVAIDMDSRASQQLQLINEQVPWQGAWGGLQTFALEIRDVEQWERLTGFILGVVIL